MGPKLLGRFIIEAVQGDKKLDQSQYKVELVRMSGEEQCVGAPLSASPPI